MLLRLAEFLEAQNRLRSKVSSADATYPIIMTVLAAAVISILMVAGGAEGDGDLRMMY